MPIVSIYGTNKIFEVNEGEVLYDSLSDKGEELPHGCLSGSCGACRIHVISGKENLQPPGVIENDTINALKDEFTQTIGPDFISDKEIRLSCRAKVMGNVTFFPIK